MFDFEGDTRFVSFGTEYYWRDDFYLRGGLRYNMAKTDQSSKEDHAVTAGFIYHPRHFNIEAAVMLTEVEVGGSFGFGLGLGRSLPCAQLVLTVLVPRCIGGDLQLNSRGFTLLAWLLLVVFVCFVEL